MKRFKIFIIVFTAILSANDFTISDPPMVYIYHFVSYDTTSIILNAGSQDKRKSKFLGLYEPWVLFSKTWRKFNYEDLRS